MNKKFVKVIAILLVILSVLSVAVANVMQSDLSQDRTTAPTSVSETTLYTETVTASQAEFEIPEYTGAAWVAIDDNVPDFDSYDIERAKTETFETYSELDSLGRCGIAFASICQELMPTEARGDISGIEPSGWTYNGKSNNNKYSEVNNGYIYNRCHLIGFQLADENANEKNLITGTRQLNIEGMLPFENKVADYVNDVDGCVLYQVTPVFKDEELVCRGVRLEGYSVDDNGEEICFDVYCFNVQKGFSIDYKTGRNSKNKTDTTTVNPTVAENVRYVVNENTNKFHKPECSAVEKISPANKMYLAKSREDMLKLGYSPCGICNP